VTTRCGAALAIALAATLAVRTRAEQPAADALPERLPERLSETGLYRPGSLAVDPRNRPFAPQYALWTDGADKRRWIQLPAGSAIAARDVDQWDFPVGTRLWKEFGFGGRKVETRMIWRQRADRWVFASYVWNEAQTDATLAPAEGLAAVAEVAPGKWHGIPARADCRTCHENGGAPVLGFSALQLSTDRDPNAPHAERLGPEMVTLRTLLDERLLETPEARRLAATPPRIPGDARTRSALGYLSANCGHCHNDRSLAATVRFPLRMRAYATPLDVDAVVTALADRTTKWDLPHSVPGTTRLVAPGAPDGSALVARMRSRRPSSQMPPLGTALADQDALALVSAWIAALPPRPGS
jgi:cytochrome c553